MLRQPLARKTPGVWRVAFEGRALNEQTWHTHLDARGVSLGKGRIEDLVRVALSEAGPDRAATQIEGHWHLVARDPSGALLGIRDGAGLHPVAWALDRSGALLMGRPSEVAQAIKAEPWDAEAAWWWLVTGSMPEPMTGWKGVYRLPAGHLVQVNGGVPTVRAWRTWARSTGGGGSQGDVSRWGQSIGGALQVAVLHRLTEHTVAVTGLGDLDTDIADLAQARRRGGLPRVEAPRDAPVQAHELAALAQDGPVVPRTAVAALAAFRTIDGAALVGAGGTARTGADGVWRAVWAKGMPGLGQLAGLRDRRLRRDQPHMALRGSVDPAMAQRLADAVGSVGGSARVTDAWAQPHGPQAWLPLGSGGGAWEARELDRLWWGPSRRFLGLSAAARVAGVELLAPWSDPSLDELCARVPLRLTWQGRNPGAFAAAIAVGSADRPDAPPGVTASLGSGDAMPPFDELDAVADRVALERIWADKSTPESVRWRLITLLAWRRAATVRG